MSEWNTKYLPTVFISDQVNDLKSTSSFDIGRQI